MAIKKEIELDIKVESVGNLKSQLKAAQREVESLSEKFGATSEQAIKAAKKAAELKDAIGDAKALTDAFNPDAKFNALTNSLSGAAAGFGAFQGALGLVGVEGEAVEKTLLKVQSAMAISQGLQQLGEAKDSFKQLGAVAKNVFSGIKGAIAATGIGLLVVALGAIYAYWDDIKAAVSGVTAEQEKLNVKAQQNLNIEKNKLDKLNGQDNTLRLQGLTERQILKLKLAQTDEIIKASEIQIKQSLNTAKAQEKAAARNKEILKGVIEFVTIPLQLILGTVDKVAKFLGKDLNLRGKLNDWAASLVFDPKEVKMEGYKVYKEQHEALEKIKNDRAGLQLQINNIDKQAHEERIRLQKENNDKLKALKDEKNKQDLEDAKNQQAFLDEAAQRELTRAEAQKNKELSTAELKKKINADYLASIKAQNDKAREEDRIAEEEDLKRRQTLNKQKLEMAQNALGVLTDAMSLFTAKNEKDARRQFKINKALSLSSAFVNTALAVTAALTAGGNPIKLATGMQFVEAGIAAASGAVAIAKIAQTQFGGSGGASGSGGGGGGSNPSNAMGGSNVITPNFNIVGNNGQNQLGNLAPVQAYVVSGEMTTQQALDRNRLRNATF